MAQLIPIPKFTDARGTLAVLEKLCPFDIRRAYWIYQATTARGGHRHRTNRQLMFALHGSVSVYVHDGNIPKEYCLQTPEEGLLLEPADWHRMEEFSRDCVLLVFASEPYDINDYIDEPYPC